MTAPCPVDPAVDVVNTFMDALREWFRPDQPCPPLGGGANAVRFFAADGALPAWDPQQMREDMFLWVRVAGRYRSTAAEFPDPFRPRGVAACQVRALFPVMAVELGIARCTSMVDDCNWEVLENEARISLDDSWRLDRALCRGERMVAGRPESPAVAVDPIGPYGPEGGVLGWMGTAYVQI